MSELQIFERLGISLLLGMLVGLQRQHVDSGIGGIRTFPLITILGTLSALLADRYGGWVIAAGLVALTGLVAVFNLVRRPQENPGLTTEFAVMAMFALGAYVLHGSLAVSVALGGGTAVLLHFKAQLHGLAGKLGDTDLMAIMQFVLISCIILPVLPDTHYGPLGVFNPYEVWMMVVLIVGISVAGYLAYKFVGAKTGTLLAGLLGGAISSTATTVSYARRSREQPDAAWLSAIVIQIASAVVYVRVLIEIAAVAPRLLSQAAGPVTVLLLLTLIPALLLWQWKGKKSQPMPEQHNPSELKSALVFAGLYLLVRYAMAAARQWLGGEGLYFVAGLSGLTDMDAITLSSARMVAQEQISADVGWRLIVLASLSNLVFKGAMVAMLGGRELLARMASLFAFPVAGGVALLLLWPAGWSLPAVQFLTEPAAQQQQAQDASAAEKADRPKDSQSRKPADR